MRTWDRKKVRTTCPFCGIGCNFDLNVADGKVVGVTAAYDAPANQGSLCVKGRFHTDLIYSPDRLTTPLIKKDGEWETATWDEALDLVAERLLEIRGETATTPSACSARRAAPTRRTTCCSASRGRASAPTTWTTAHVPDTLPRWPVWRPRWVRAR